jgi:tellurite resistance protein
MFVKRIAIFDGSVIPEPILAIRAVMVREPQLVAKEIQPILEFVAEIVERECLGKPHYWATAMAAISFVCTARQVEGMEIDWGQWMPLVLAKLPVKGDEMEAENIYATLVAVAEESRRSACRTW